MKICTCCGNEKPENEFYKRSASKDGYKPMCKLCDNEKQKGYSNAYKKRNKVKVKISRSKHYYANKERINKTRKKLTGSAKEKRNKYLREYKKKRIEKDSLFKITISIRRMISNRLKSKLKYNLKATNQILGCTFEEFKQHIEKQFLWWMKWENYGNPKDGLIEPNKTWDLDHIIPVASAKTEEELIKLNHYTNYQPLCSYINRKVKRATM